MPKFVPPMPLVIFRQLMSSDNQMDPQIDIKMTLL